MRHEGMTHACLLQMSYLALRCLRLNRFGPLVRRITNLLAQALYRRQWHHFGPLEDHEAQECSSNYRRNILWSLIERIKSLVAKAKVRCGFRCQKLHNQDAMLTQAFCSGTGKSINSTARHNATHCRELAKQESLIFTRLPRWHWFLSTTCSRASARRVRHVANDEYPHVELFPEENLNAFGEHAVLFPEPT
jgi:hypothetical protein